MRPLGFNSVFKSLSKEVKNIRLSCEGRSERVDMLVDNLMDRINEADANLSKYSDQIETQW